MEKPRDKLSRIGDPKKLSTEELISIIIGHGTSKTDVYDLSNQIVEYLRANKNQETSIDDLVQFDGIGEAKALQILSALEIGRRYHTDKYKKKLSDDDWDFANLTQSERQYGVHFFHHYTAKFIPQIPARLIRQLANPLDVIVDPFMGSGTALIEAKLLGCHSFGLDTNPMAINITRSKTVQIHENGIDEINKFLHWLNVKKKQPELDLDKIETIELFEDSQLWFRKDVAHKIHSFLCETKNYSPDLQNFFKVGLSTLLKGMSNARMDSVTPVLPDQPIYIDRKHYYREVNNLTRKIPVFQRLYSQLNRMKNAILDFNKETDENLICKPLLGDARHLSEYVEHCDLVVTSPPYWSAQNYARIHMLSMKLFGLKTDEGQEIGRDNTKYLMDMEIVFLEIAKILKGHFALVIGEDTKMKIHEKMFDIAQISGFEHMDTITRRISNQVSRAKQIKQELIYIFRI